MSEWVFCTLGEIADVQTGPFGSQLHLSDYQLVGTPIITVEHLNDNRITYQNLPLVGEADKERLGKYLIYEGDIVFSRVGSVDRCALVSEKEDGWLFSGRLLRVRANRGVISPKFLSYYFGQESFKEHIRRIAVGATMPSINTTILSEVEISYPPRPQQEAIAAVLSALDDKIDLLQRQNKTLEALAQTLFRHWFVDGAGDDWEVMQIGDVLTAVGGTTPSTKNPEYWDGDVHWTTPRDLSNNDGIYLLDTARKITERGLAKISSGLLPRGTLLLSSRAPVGYLAFAEVPLAVNQGYIAIIDDKAFSKTFIYLWLKENMDYVKSYAGGTTFQEISKSTFRSLEIVVPTQRLLVEFEQIVFPMFEKIRANTHQIAKLQELRDTLLPKLMNGEVRVRL